MRPRRTRSGRLAAGLGRDGVDGEVGGGVAGGLQLPALLEVQPEFGGGGEGCGEAQGGVAGDAAPPGRDGADAVGRHADVAREAAGAEAEGQEEVLAQDFAGVDRGDGWRRL